MPIGPHRTPDTPRLVSWPTGERLWRVAREPTGLVPATEGHSSRFSPLFDREGSVVPAWYGASSPTGALFESVFHRVRTTDRAPIVSPGDFVDRVLAPVRTVRPLVLIDLTTTGLHAIGMSRARLIESRPGRYPWTRSIAARLVAAAPHADGLTWVSRADDTSRSVVLYLPRARGPALEPDLAREPLALGIGAGLEMLRVLATEARITLWLPGPD